jgi:nucleotide-binding universal stress UspA family protein/CBS domain-containing protein
MRALQQILVPVDYSEASKAALGMAADFARAFKARLLVLHLLRFDVFGMSEFYPMAMPGQSNVGDEMDLAAETKRLEEHVRQVLGNDAPAFEAAVDWGSPYRQIVEYAIERHADLIVIGTHGRTGITHALIGSVAEKTVRLAPCPVLTVRADTAANAAALGEVEEKHREAARPSGAVGRLMCRVPVTVGPDDMLSKARAAMARYGVRHLPVVEGTRLVGILSDRDLPQHVGHFERTHVHVAMTPNPATVSADVGADTAARLMLDRRVRALPVVEGERVIGVLTASDILEDYVRAARG